MTRPESALVLVTYYVDSAQEAEDLVVRFEAQTGLHHDVVLLVENRVPLAPASDERDIRRVIGDNTAWEFSGMVAGLRACEALEPVVCTVLNDSYGRNWDVSSASRPILRKMHDWGMQGGVAAWQDVFTWLPFQQRCNSRVLIGGGSAVGALRTAIESSIARERGITEAGLPLFSADDARTLDRWESKNPGRWSSDGLSRRRRRIYLEHTMLDDLLDPVPRLFPSGLCAAAQYSFRRKMEGERR